MFYIDKVKTFFSGNGRSVKVKRNIIASFGVRGMSLLASFLLVPLTIGYISPDLYGVWMTLSSIMTWLVFLDIGFTQGMKNKVTEAIALNQRDRAKSLVSTTYFMMILIFIPLCLFLELIIPLVDWTKLLNVNVAYQLEIIKTVQILVVFFCMNMILNVLDSIVAAFQQVALSNSFSAFGQILALGAIYFCIHFVKPSLDVLVFAISAMPVLITLVASFILYGKSYKEVSPSWQSVDFKKIPELFSLGYKFFVINIQVVVLYQSTNFLIANLSSPLQVTSYNIAYKYLNLAMMVCTIIFAPLWPAYTDAYTRKDFEWMRRIRQKMFSVYGVMVFACITMILLSPWFYNLWVGDKTHIPLLMTCLVGLYVMAYSWMNLNGTLVVGMGTIKVETIIVCIGMIVHIPLSLFLGKFYSAYGVLISMILINLFYGLIFHIQVSKILKGKASGIWLE